MSTQQPFQGAAEHRPPPHPHPVQYEIFVNGKPRKYHHEQISYEDVVRLAFPQGPFDILYTVEGDTVSAGTAIAFIARAALPVGCNGRIFPSVRMALERERASYGRWGYSGAGSSVLIISAEWA